MKKGRIIVATLMITMLLGTTGVYAHGGHGHGHGGGDGSNNKNCEPKYKCNIKKCKVTKKHKHKVCTYKNCTKKKAHKHKGKYYKAHHKNDGHKYHKHW